MGLNSPRQMSVGAETQTLTFLCCQHSCLQYILSPLFLSFPRHTLLHVHTPLLFFIFCFTPGSTLHPEATGIINSLDASAVEQHNSFQFSLRVNKLYSENFY